MQEYERIVEYSYNERQSCFVVRFLDGSSYSLSITNLPKKLQTKKPDWENSQLNKECNALIVKAGNDLRQIPYNIIHARGKML